MAQTNEEPIVRIAELEIDLALLDSYKAFLRAEIEASIDTERGVLMLYALSVRSAPSHIRIIEVYANQEAYEAHLNSPHFLTYKAQTSPMIRSLHLVETDPIVLCSKS